MIVGGGTAGWITACLLAKALKGRSRITLIESKTQGKIGVGEATVPTLRGTLKRLGISEREFLTKCRATFKLGVKLIDWRKPQDGWPSHFFNPFGPMKKYQGLNLSEFWLKGLQTGWPLPLDYSCSFIPSLCDGNRAPKFLQQPEYLGTVDYGYHVDAHLLANFLKNSAVNQGVGHFFDDLEKVELDSRGAIRSILTKKKKRYSADLYIDCTGFRGLLINKALGEPFLSYSHQLLCDSAVSLNLPDAALGREIPPYTGAVAREAGWIWRIPLRRRWGTGYVFSSGHLAPERAEAELRTYWDLEKFDGEITLIKMRVGRNRRAWVKNCLSVGLAAGFVEPLESSGIGFIYIAIEKILPLLLKGLPGEKEIEKFNRYFANLFDMVRDYLTLHYVLSGGKNGPFWRDAREGVELPDSLNTSLEQWRRHFPGDRPDSTLVRFYDYKVAYLLGGFAFLPEGIHPKVKEISSEKVDRKLQNIQIQARELAQHLPGHAEFLNQY